MGVSGKIRHDEIQPIKKMKFRKNIKLRAVGGYLAILLAQTYNTNAAPGDIDTYAGIGQNLGFTYGLPADQASVGSPRWIYVEPDGSLTISESGRQIAYIDSETRILRHYASQIGVVDPGDGGPATEAGFGLTNGVTRDSAGNLYIVDSFWHNIRKVDAETRIVSTVAGTGAEGFSGDGGSALLAELMKPDYIAVDQSGNIYFGDSDGTRIRRIDGVSGIITTIAGTGVEGFSGDGDLAVNAKVNGVNGIKIGPDGNLYFADSQNHRIRMINLSTGTIDSVAGRGHGNVEDGIHALLARLKYPSDICFDGAGNMFIADRVNYTIRRVDAETRIITSVAGTGVNDHSGDGGPALEATFGYVYSLGMDDAGNLYLPTFSNNRIRIVESVGVPISRSIDEVAAPATSAIDRAILLRKMKKLKKKLKKAKQAGRTSTVRKLKKQIRKMKKRM